MFRGIRSVFFFSVFILFSACDGGGSDKKNSDSGNSNDPPTADPTPPVVEDPTPIDPGVYIDVPADTELGVPAFRVMKYEAKNSGAATTEDATDDIPISKAEEAPWVQIDQTEAWNKCRTLNTEDNDAGINDDVNEDGTYALISNPEWMSLARDIENVAENWTSGTVGTDCLFRGNVGAALPCGGVDSGYNGLERDSGTSRSSTTAKLTLSNGEEIWDLSGNVWEWVDWKRNNELTTVDPAKKAYVSEDGSSKQAWRDFNQLDTNIGEDDQMPRASWEPTNSSLGISHGIGGYLSGFDGFGGAAVRGGRDGNGERAGVFALFLGEVSLSLNEVTGFRCVYRPRPPS